MFVLVLSPYAPHIGEELWEKLGNNSTLAFEVWPSYDENLIKKDLVTVAIQINGKLRETISISPTLGKDEVLSLVKENIKIQTYLAGVTIKKEIFVPGRLVNLVVS